MDPHVPDLTFVAAGLMLLTREPPGWQGNGYYQRIQQASVWTQATRHPFPPRQRWTRSASPAGCCCCRRCRRCPTCPSSIVQCSEVHRCLCREFHPSTAGLLSSMSRRTTHAEALFAMGNVVQLAGGWPSLELSLLARTLMPSLWSKPTASCCCLPWVVGCLANWPWYCHCLLLLHLSAGWSACVHCHRPLFLRLLLQLIPPFAAAVCEPWRSQLPLGLNCPLHVFQGHSARDTDCEF